MHCLLALVAECCLVLGSVGDGEKIELEKGFEWNY